MHSVVFLHVSHKSSVASSVNYIAKSMWILKLSQPDVLNVLDVLVKYSILKPRALIWSQYDTKLSKLYWTKICTFIRFSQQR